MSANKAFTLAEMIAVMVIIAILACIALPNLANVFWNTEVQNFEKNLSSIAAAQQKYYEDHGYYCGLDPQVPPLTPSGGCQTLSSINQDLGLNIPSPPTDYPWNYYCFINHDYSNVTPMLNIYACTVQNSQPAFQAQDLVMTIYSNNNPDLTPYSNAYQQGAIFHGNPTCQHQYNWSFFSCP